MCSFDVRDAYLTVDQKKPTVISTTLSGETIVHELLKCVPGKCSGMSRSSRIFQNQRIGWKLEFHDHACAC